MTDDNYLMSNTAAVTANASSVLSGLTCISYNYTPTSGIQDTGLLHYAISPSSANIALPSSVSRLIPPSNVGSYLSVDQVQVLPLMLKALNEHTTTLAVPHFFSNNTSVSNSIVWVGSSAVAGGTASFYPTCFPSGVFASFCTAQNNTTTSTAMPFASLKSQSANAIVYNVQCPVTLLLNSSVLSSMVAAPNGTVCSLVAYGW